MNARIGTYFKGEKAAYFIAAFLSAVFFTSIYGIHVINPLNDSWILEASGDLSQHYLGFLAYRSSKWMFPFGMLNTIAYPKPTSVIFTDSIPGVAVFFKLLSPVLPQKFQYFGLWGLTSFIIQGVLGVRIILNFTKNKVVCVGGSLLLVATPVMLFRMFTHTALAGQWIILLSLEPLFSYNRYNDKRKFFWKAITIGIIAASVHMYYILMCGVILASFCFLRFLKEKDKKEIIKSDIIILSAYIAVSGVLVFLYGGFSSGVRSWDFGLGDYGFNLNSFFNSMGWSRFFHALPLANKDQYEGFGYLGFGCILFAFLSFVFFFLKKDNSKKIKRFLPEIIALSACFTVELAIAISNVITFGGKTLIRIKLPGIIFKMWSVFRASGRFCWPCVYIIVITSIIMAIKSDRRYFAAFLTSVCLVIQIFDISIKFKPLYTKVNAEEEYKVRMEKSDLWENIRKRNVRHIVFSKSVIDWYVYDYAYYALPKGFTLSRFPFARLKPEQLEEYRQDMINKRSDDCIFIFSTDDKEEFGKYDMNYYYDGGCILGYYGVLEGSDSINPAELKK